MDTVINLDPYWNKIVDHYWANLDPSTDGSIWDVLAREYHARRRYTHRRPDSSRMMLGRSGTMLLEFESETYMTLFLLRWA
jgi:hypothetical protein